MWRNLAVLACFSVLPSSSLFAQTAAPAGAPQAVLDSSSAPKKDSSKTELNSQPTPAASTPAASNTAATSAAPSAPVTTEAPVTVTQPRKDTLPTPMPIPLMAPLLSKLNLGGTIQLKGLYHNFSSDRDADKKLSLTLRRFKLDLDGAVDSHFGFKGSFLMDGNNKNFGVEDVYLYYTLNDLVGFKGGKFKRPFSQEALQSSKSLYTVERGELYQDFLSNVTGYTNFDIGIMAYGGFVDEGHAVGYEVGLFNGKQNNDASKDYSGQHYETTDKGFLAKDAVMRLTASPFELLKIEAAISTKAAEDTTNPADFAYNVNTAYEVGFSYLDKHLRLLGEVSWGDNQNKLDANIINGGSRFFAFYGTGIWHSDYSMGRASELVLKLEGLDPDFELGKGKGKPNDGKLRYTIGTNYFFTPRVSILANYGILQPITKVIGEGDLVHDLDVLVRISY